MGRRSPMRNKPIRHEEVAYDAKASIGTWIHAGTRGSLTSAKDAVRNIETAYLTAYEPAGSFEARYELGDEDYEIYTRIPH